MKNHNTPEEYKNKFHIPFQNGIILIFAVGVLVLLYFEPTNKYLLDALSIGPIKANTPVAVLIVILMYFIIKSIIDRLSPSQLVSLIKDLNKNKGKK